MKTTDPLRTHPNAKTVEIFGEERQRYQLVRKVLFSRDLERRNVRTRECPNPNCHSTIPILEWAKFSLCNLLSLCGGLFWMEGDGNFSLPCLLPLDTDSSTCKNKNARRELFPAKDVLTRFWLFWANFSPKKRCIYLSCYHYHYHKEKLSLEGIHIILAVSSLIQTDVLFSPLPNQA